METIDFNTSRIYFKKNKWLHGENDIEIDINTLDKTQKLQAIEYLKGIQEETKAKLSNGFLLNQSQIESYKLFINTIHTYLVELGVNKI
jgi:hypothetical protein